MGLIVVSCGGRGQKEDIQVGAERADIYTDLLRRNTVALYCNLTAVSPAPGGMRHTLDVMLDRGIDVRWILAPEHGFRGTADAGAAVSDDIDPATGIQIRSLYGKGSEEAIRRAALEADVIVCDIQDVGLRFYTYYITMIRLMEAASETGKRFMILDRPNPNGMYVDGPVLDMNYASGVGRLPIPVVHGMTLGELAKMADGEGWLKSEPLGDRLTVIPCKGYTHASRYRLPVPPSPNLKDMKAVYLYPSTCFFEGTPVSLGRGTEAPFCMYGHPSFEGDFEFTPQRLPGASNPPQLGQDCRGRDLRGLQDEAIIAEGLDLSYVLDAFERWKAAGGDPEGFFTPFFDLLAGTDQLREQILAGWTREQIEASWQPALESYKALRQKYLLYPEE